MKTLATILLTIVGYQFFLWVIALATNENENAIFWGGMAIPQLLNIVWQYAKGTFEVFYRQHFCQFCCLSEDWDKGRAFYISNRLYHTYQDKRGSYGILQKHNSKPTKFMSILGWERLNKKTLDSKFFKKS